MLNKFKKNVLILSSSKGIGYGIAKNLLNNNYNVAISSSNIHNLRNSKAKLKEDTKVEPYAMKLDLKDSKNLKKNLKKILKYFNNVIDILILNGPGPSFSKIDKLNQSKIMNALNINLLNQIFIVRQILPLMKKNKFGRIINLSSTVAKEPSEGMVLSSLTRSSMLAFCKTVAIEYGQYNITSNSILTGGVLTDRIKKLFSKKELKNINKKIPVGFIANKDQFALFINFLCSENSLYINGTSIPIDGGLTKFI